jgi:Flp pilus assembly CpaE family ATPase
MPESAFVGRSVLVLDKNSTSRFFLFNLLVEKEFRVTGAASGKEALISAWRDKPDLILFDPVLEDIDTEEFIQKLRNDPRTSNTLLVAFSSDPSPALRETCLSAGVHEYLIKSAQALPELEQFLTRLSGAEKPAETEAGQNRRSGLLIVFLSAKGGTGTSSLCANLAMTMKLILPASRIVVADLVLPIGSIAPIVGYKGPLNLATLADLPPKQTNVEYFLKHLPHPDLWEFQLLPGSPDPQHGNIINGERINEIVEMLRSAYDVVVLDLGRALSRISLPLIQKADLIPLIISGDLSTIQLTKTVQDYLQTQDIDDDKMYLILNRVVGLEGLTKAEAEELLGLTIKAVFPYMGGNFGLANNMHQPIITKYPTDTATFILKETAENMFKLAHRHRSREYT